VNTGNFAGYIGRDAETKSLPSGSSVTNFSLAVATGWGDKKSTLWVSCDIWGERGEKLCQYLTKGSAVSVSGDIDVRPYSAKDGTAKAEMKCNVQRVTLQGGGARDEEAPARGVPTSTGLPTGKDFQDDKDLPF
jgi:single-strand DNA-binding protein